MRQGNRWGVVFSAPVVSAFSSRIGCDMVSTRRCSIVFCDFEGCSPFTAWYATGDTVEGLGLSSRYVQYCKLCLSARCGRREWGRLWSGDPGELGSNKFTVRASCRQRGPIGSQGHDWNDSHSPIISPRAAPFSLGSCTYASTPYGVSSGGPAVRQTDESQVLRR